MNFEFSSIFAAVDTALAAQSADLVPLALSLLGSLAVIRVTWFGLQLALKGGEVDTLLGPFVRLVLVIFFALWATKGGLMTGIVDITDKVLEGLGVGSGQLAVLGAQGIDRLVGAIGGLGDAIAHIIKPELLHPFDTIGRMIQFGVPVLVIGLSIGIIMAAGVVFFISVALGAVLLKIAAILAPVFIPWMIWPNTSFIFDGWLRFAIVAALYKPVAAVIAGIGNAILGGMGAVLKALPAGNTVASIEDTAQVMLAAVGAASIAGLVLFLMLKVGEIASALVGGGASVNADDIVRRMGGRWRGGGGRAAPAKTAAGG